MSTTVTMTLDEIKRISKKTESSLIIILNLPKQRVKHCGQR
ncbi:hypothetical protein [Treponema sp. OMZ 840]